MMAFCVIINAVYELETPLGMVRHMVLETPGRRAQPQTGTSFELEPQGRSLRRGSPGGVPSTPGTTRDSKHTTLVRHVVLEIPGRRAQPQTGTNAMVMT